MREEKKKESCGSEPVLSCTWCVAVSKLSPCGLHGDESSPTSWQCCGEDAHELKHRFSVESGTVNLSKCYLLIKFDLIQIFFLCILGYFFSLFSSPTPPPN